MLTRLELCTLTTVPKMSDISLQSLLNFYEKTLCRRIFEYTLEDSAGNITVINVSFKGQDFCHLIGLHHIKSINSTIIKGHRGYSSIKNNKVTFQTLKKINAKKFSETKERIKYFPFIYQLLQCPKVVKFNKAVIAGETKLECDMIFYKPDIMTKRIHLGIDAETPPKYFGRTYMVEKNNKEKWIKNQEIIKVTKIKIINVMRIKFKLTKVIKTIKK